jgi:hypothetical protein
MSSLRGEGRLRLERFIVYGMSDTAFGLLRNGPSLQSEGIYNIDESLRRLDRRCRRRIRHHALRAVLIEGRPTSLAVDDCHAGSGPNVL